jgi:hypothetical protein
MRVTVRFHGIYRSFAPRVAELDLPGEATLRDLIHALGKCHGERLLRELLSEDGRLSQAATIAVGESQGEERLDVTLRELAGESPELDIFFIQAIQGG